MRNSIIRPETSSTCSGFSSVHLLLALSFILIQVSCGENKQPSKPMAYEPAGTQEKEWFWRDRLGQRPKPLAVISCPAKVEQEVRTLLSGLKGLAPPEAREAIELIAGRGECAIDAVAPFVSDGDRTQRFAAVSAISRISGPRSSPVLLKALRDEWDAPAVLAAVALGQDPEPWILPRLIKAIGPYPVDFNPHLMVRIQAAAALLKLGNYSGIPFLIKVLKDNTPEQDPAREWEKNTRLAWEKEEALKILSDFTGKEFGFRVDAPIEEQAEAALGIESWWLANRVSLWKKAPPLEDPMLCAKIDELVKGLASYQARCADGARYCLKSLGPPVFPYLAEAVRSGGFYESYHSLDIVAELAVLSGGKAASWADKIGPALEAESAAVRAKAVKAVGCLGQKSSLPMLERAFDDPDPDVRLSSVKAIGLIKGKQARTILDKLLTRELPGQMIVEAKAALVRISPAYEDAFLEELLSQDPRRSEWAAQKLLELTGDDCGFQPLEEREEAMRKAKEALIAWRESN